MPKYELLRQRVEAECSGLRLAEAEPASDGELALAHTPDYIDAVTQGTLSAAAQREIGFPWSERMVLRSRRSVGATIAGIGALLGREGPDVAARCRIDVRDDCVGEGYGIPTEASTEAQALAAHTEAIFVDHTYTAKALGAHGFTVIASLEKAGRDAGGQGLFGWIGTLRWSNPMVLSAILAFLMLIAGGFGGIVNASYAMNAMVHNTAWVPGHFHLIFGGTTVIMYFAVAYAVWPRLTGKALISGSLPLVQLWSWFIGMIILSTPWHILGLLGQPRRISSVVYNSLLTLAWDPYELAMIIGGAVLLGSALLFLHILAKSQKRGEPVTEQAAEIHYAESEHPVVRMPALLNGFGFWNLVILALMLANFGYPILQFFLTKTYGSTGWGY